MNKTMMLSIAVLVLVIGIGTNIFYHAAEARSLPKHDQKNQIDNKVDKKMQHFTDIRDKMLKAKFKLNPLAKVS